MQYPCNQPFHGQSTSSKRGMAWDGYLYLFISHFIKTQSGMAHGCWLLFMAWNLLGQLATANEHHPTLAAMAYLTISYIPCKRCSCLVSFGTCPQVKWQKQFTCPIQLVKPQWLMIESRQKCPSTWFPIYYDIFWWLTLFNPPCA